MKRLDSNELIYFMAQIDDMIVSLREIRTRNEQVVSRASHELCSAIVKLIRINEHLVAALNNEGHNGEARQTREATDHVIYLQACSSQEAIAHGSYRFDTFSQQYFIEIYD